MLFPKPADVNIDMSETRLVGMTFMEYIIPNLEFNLGYIVPAGNNLMSSMNSSSNLNLKVSFTFHNSLLCCLSIEERGQFFTIIYKRNGFICPR